MMCFLLALTPLCYHFLSNVDFIIVHRIKLLFNFYGDRNELLVF